VPDRPHPFEAVFREHARALLGYALRRTTNPEDAADAVAETMLVAWRRWEDVPGGEETRPWLFGVARKMLSNQRRSSDRTSRLGSKLRIVVSDVTRDDHADDIATALVVREALERLDEDDREIIRLTSWEGLSAAEIGFAMSMPPATARTRLHRARARLRIELEQMSPAGHVEDDERVLVRRMEGRS